MPVSPSRTRPSTAGRTMSTTTSVPLPRARTSVPASSSTTPSALFAPRPGPIVGTVSARVATSLSTLTSR
ncbi:hypothetical protein VN97_g8855 [Penicillium thymicola]|uniref:Uncharacterized protein n=1 Tax=Penicillium thymicola TaxID=293382 RepID=A0AAI9TD17_PENTH|nr:hypothetical protein VN97_g8855 [Penicillium thymicola]